jgi:hypothetical protein
VFYGTWCVHEDAHMTARLCIHHTGRVHQNRSHFSIQMFKTGLIFQRQILHSNMCNTFFYRKMRDNLLKNRKYSCKFKYISSSRVIEIKYVHFKFIPFLHPIVAPIFEICLRFQSRKIVPFRKDVFLQI